MILYIRLRYSDTQRATSQTCTLDGVRVKLYAQYNATAGRWYLSVYTTDDTLLAGSIALVPCVDLLLPYKYRSGVPQGRLYVEDPINGTPPDLTTLDASALLKYETVS
jgi:hypothetical protein